MSDDALAATRTVRVIRSPPGSQLEDLQTSMGDDILQMIMIVCLRDGKEAVEQLRVMYPEEANNVALDIRTKLGELALQHQASAQLASAS
jgi:hypothetical protein